MRALLLPLGDSLYAIDLAAAREVVSAPEIAPLPTAPPTVLGVLNLRGEIVPVFDAAGLLGRGAIPVVSHVAVIETELGPAGLAVTGAGEAAQLGETVGTTDTPATRGSFSVDGRLVVLVDVEELLAPLRAGV